MQNNNGRNNGASSSAGTSRSQPQQLIQAYATNTQFYPYPTTGYYDTKGNLVPSNYVSSTSGEQRPVY